MNSKVKEHLPETAIAQCDAMINEHRVVIKVVKKRKTRHGDYKKLLNGTHQITINTTENKYRFLITLIHEIAHLMAFSQYGRQIKPHGIEWKQTFQSLMLPFLRPQIFPAHLLPILARHFKNPKASSSTDTNLCLALNKFDIPSGKNNVADLPIGSTFKLYNGKIFRRGNKRVKRYECKEVNSGKLYLFQPHAEVEMLSD